MRKLLLSVLAAVLLLINIQESNGQAINFQFTFTNASSDSTCDGQITVQYSNSPSPLNYRFYEDNGFVLATGNSVSGLCSGKGYNLEMYNSNCQYYGFWFYLPDSANGTTSQLDVTVNLSDSLNYASVEINQYTGGTAPHIVTFMSDYNTIYDTLPPISIDTLISISNIVFNNLEANSSLGYYFYINEINYSIDDNKIGFYFNTSFDSTGSCGYYSNNLFASAQGTLVSDSTTCDGTAYVEVYGGTPPYSYQFSSGSTNSTETGLCPGSYIVTITDADSNVFSSIFVIGYPGTYYFSDGGNYNYLDTLYSNAMQDCGIDYSMPIDSFYIDSAYALSNWEYVVNWTIIQDSNQFLFTETYFIDSTGYYWFGLSLYCDTRSSDFGSYTFFAGAMAEMSGAPTGITDVNADDLVSVYPNPSNGVYNLKAASKMESYSICDQLGRSVLSKNINSDNESINLSEMNSGMYYLTVLFQDGTSGRQKLVKK